MIIFKRLSCLGLFILSVRFLHEHFLKREASESLFGLYFLFLVLRVFSLVFVDGSRLFEHLELLSRVVTE